MKTAFVYHRYSTLLQKDKYTLEAQRRITKELADKYEAVIIQAYEDEAISGATIEKRPSMSQLLHDLEEIKPTYLIVTDQDRISRSNDFWYIKGKLALTKTAIITEHDGIIEIDNAAKEVLSDMRAAFAKYERSGIKDRVKRGIEQKMRSGLHFGQEPIGYYRKNKTIEVNEYAVHVKKIFELAMSGLSVSAIVKYMYNNNYKTQTGFNYSGITIKAIIQNTAYIGMIRYKDEIYQGKHEPIIDEFTFNEANKKLEARFIHSRTRPHTYLLSGFLYCGICGVRMAGCWKQRNHDHARLYRCVNSLYGTCYSSIVAKIDDIVMELLRQKVLAMKLKPVNGIKVISKPIRVAKNYNDIIASKMKILLDHRLAGDIDEVTFRIKNNELKNTLELSKEQNKNKEISPEMLAIVKNAKVKTLWDELEFAHKREILDMFIERIIIEKSIDKNWENRIKIEYKIIR